jgi:hypothetical protein
MRSRQHIRFQSLLAGLAILSLQFLFAVDGMRATVSPPRFADLALEPPEVPALMANYCSGCHQAGRAGIDLDGPINHRAVRRDQHTWEKILYALRCGAMPPARAPQPAPADRQRMIGWIEERFARLAAEGDCRLVVRRLRSREYSNAVRDLLGVSWAPPSDFPEDDPEWDLAVTMPALPEPLRREYEAAAAGIVATANFDTRLAGADDAHALLATLAPRAYRGPVAADEMARLSAVLDRAISGGAVLADALRSALREVLVSPRFLFHVEQRALAEGAEDSAISEHELAARLAAFLWQSIPDETLLHLADTGRLRLQLAEQVHRMMRDPRAASLARDFAGGWLKLDRLDEGSNVAEELLQAMRQETEHVVAHIVGEDRSVLELLDADYTFLNEQLATHYGIAGVRGSVMRRVSVAGTPRGGLVTQGSFLVLTSENDRAAPVQRGKWILTNLLGTPPPPPPIDVLNGFFQPVKGNGAVSVHQALALHREHTSCARCHAQLDGIGLALADFDSHGAWQRQAEPAAEELVVMPDGEKLRNAADLKSYLLDRRELFLRALGGKLLSYGLGRKLQESDRAALEPVAAGVLAEPRFGNVLVRVIESTPFQSRAWEP